MLQLGLIGEAALVVEPSKLATAVGSGTVEVFSTPSLIALMERAACEAVAGRLDAGQTTVGVAVEVRHLAASPLGVRVHARAELIEIDGRKLVFRVEAFDTHDKIGEGTHERAVIDPTRLLARATAKLASLPRTT